LKQAQEKGSKNVSFNAKEEKKLEILMNSDSSVA